MTTLRIHWQPAHANEAARAASGLARRLRDELRRSASEARGPDVGDAAVVVSCRYDGMEFRLRLHAPEQRWRLDIECVPPPLDERLSWDAERLPGEVFDSFERRIETLVGGDPRVSWVGWDL